MDKANSHKYLGNVRKFLRLDKLPPVARKVIVFTVGGLFLIAGVIMLVTPGPALLLIPLGLMILGFEFKWAETAAQKLIELWRRTRRKWKNRKRPSHAH